MQQINLLKLFGFVVFLFVYTALFDPSFTDFFVACENLKNLNIHYTSILTVGGWLVGMWGLLLFLNSNKNGFRISMMALFIITSLINFCFFKIIHEPFSSANLAKFDEVLLRLPEIPNIDLVKFITMSIAFVIFARYIKPLNIGFNKIFVIILACTIGIDMFVYGGNKMPLPSLYVVSTVIFFKYAVIFANLIQAKMGLSNTASK